MLKWFAEFIESVGLLGIALLMFLENVFPPIPSEIVMPFAGFVAARGDMNLIAVIASGTAGSLAGALFWYAVGRKLGLHRLKDWSGRHGRWLTLKPAEFDTAITWFERHGPKAVFLGRLVPVCRSLISVPAGIIGMPLGRFLLWSALGTGAWTTLLAISGFHLAENYAAVADILNPLTEVLVATLVVIYLYRVVRFKA